MRKIFFALCTMVSVITGNAQNTPIGENIEFAGENHKNIAITQIYAKILTTSIERYASQLRQC